MLCNIKIKVVIKHDWNPDLALSSTLFMLSLSTTLYHKNSITQATTTLFMLSSFCENILKERNNSFSQATADKGGTIYMQSLKKHCFFVFQLLIFHKEFN